MPRQILANYIHIIGTAFQLLFLFYTFSRFPKKNMKEIRRFNKQKGSQKSDIPIKIIKGNTDIFADYLNEAVNSATKIFNSLNCLKLADITP